MALLGSAALGLVLGWLSFLVGRGTRGMLGVSARAFAFACVALAGAASLGFFHVGLSGVLAAAIGVGAGVLAAEAALGIGPAASSIDQTGG